MGEILSSSLLKPTPLSQLLCLLSPPPPPPPRALSSPHLLISPFPTLLSASFSCSHATPPASSPRPLSLPPPAHLSPTPRRRPSQALPVTPRVPSTDRGQALRTPCAAQGYRKARPLQRRNTGRGTQAATPPRRAVGRERISLGAGAAVCQWVAGSEPLTRAVWGHGAGFSSGL